MFDCTICSKSTINFLQLWQLILGAVLPILSLSWQYYWNICWGTNLCTSMYIKTVPKKMELALKYATNKNVSFLDEILWNFVKMMYPLVGQIAKLQLNWWKILDFLLMEYFFMCSIFFGPVSLFIVAVYDFAFEKVRKKWL